jgi:hypothetical protein
LVTFYTLARLNLLASSKKAWEPITFLSGSHYLLLIGRSITSHNTERPGDSCTECSTLTMNSSTALMTSHNTEGPGDSRTVEKPTPCIPTPPQPNGFMAPCPGRGYLEGCVVNCGVKSHNCEECFGNTTQPVLMTKTAAECQAACENDHKCGAFQWTGANTDHAPSNLPSTALQYQPQQCIFKCPGAMNPGTSQCIIDRKEGPMARFVAGLCTRGCHWIPHLLVCSA